MLIIHMFLIILMLVIVTLGFSDSGMIPFLNGIIILSIISLVFLRYGKLTTVTLITYIATGLFASLIVFNRLSYNIYETYMLATIHMSITVVASLLTNQRRYTLVTTGLGVIYIILLYFFRGVPLSSSTQPLEIDDYLVVIALLIMTGLIVTSTVTRQKRLLEIAKVESVQNIAKAKQIKQSEENLKQSHSLLSATLESTADGILVVNSNGKITNLNKKFIELWSIPESVIASHDDEKAISFIIDQLIDPDGFLKKVKELYSKDDQTSIDVLEFKDGRTFERYSQPQIVDGKSVGRVWSFRDITERKRANERIESQTKQQQKLLEMGREVTSFLDIDTVLKYVSDKVRILLGAQGVTIYMLENQGKTLSPILSYDPPFDKDVMAAKIDAKSSLAGKAIKAKKGLIFNDADKQAGSYHVPGTPLDDDHLMVVPFIIEGKSIGSLNVYRKLEPFIDEDLTLVETFTLYASTAINNAQVHRDLLDEIADRKQAEGDLYRSEERYQVLVESLKEGIGRVDENETFTLVNQAAADMFGYSKDEMIGKNLRKLVSPESYDQIIEQTAKRKAGASSKYELEIEREEGINRFIEVSATPINSEKEEFLGTFAIFHDITERKQAETELSESDNLKELLLDIITHDLRNPAATIFSFSELAQKSSPGNKVIDLIHSSSERLIKVLENTTVLTHATFGEKVPKVGLNLFDCVAEVVDDLTISIQTSKMELELDIPKRLKVLANPLITEIFKNYISNATKYARDGKKILVEAVEEEESILVSVKDFGKTIPKEDRMHVFERNVQLAKENKRGRGLGLAIVKRIAAAHGGEAWVEPNTPQGNKFCLRIPRQKG